MGLSATKQPSAIQGHGLIGKSMPKHRTTPRHCQVFSSGLVNTSRNGASVSFAKAKLDLKASATEPANKEERCPLMSES
jgi:hypothetical protein